MPIFIYNTEFYFFKLDPYSFSRYLVIFVTVFIFDYKAFRFCYHTDMSAASIVNENLNKF